MILLKQSLSTIVPHVRTLFLKVSVSHKRADPSIEEEPQQK